MIQAAYPGHSAFDAHAEAGVGNGAVAAEIEVPGKGFEGQVVLLDPFFQQIIRSNTLRTTDDFSIAFRRQYVDA